MTESCKPVVQVMESTDGVPCIGAVEISRNVAATSSVSQTARMAARVLNEWQLPRFQT
jgi:hypothetical protein